MSYVSREGMIGANQAVQPKSLSLLAMHRVACMCVPMSAGAQRLRGMRGGTGRRMATSRTATSSPLPPSSTSRTESEPPPPSSYCVCHDNWQYCTTQRIIYLIDGWCKD